MLERSFGTFHSGSTTAPPRHIYSKEFRRFERKDAKTLLNGKKRNSFNLSDDIVVLRAQIPKCWRIYTQRERQSSTYLLYIVIFMLIPEEVEKIREKWRK